MEYFIFVENGILNGAGQCRQLTEGVINFEVSEEVYNKFIEDTDLYIWDGEKVIENPNYEEVKRQKEKERIGNLTMTKRVFALILAEQGITYSQLKELIETNERAQLEWDLCEHLNRNNPLLDIMAAQMGITSEQLDEMFKRANEEV